jgi:hypothetical protein
MLIEVNSHLHRRMAVDKKSALARRCRRGAAA